MTDLSNPNRTPLADVIDEEFFGIVRAFRAGEAIEHWSLVDKAWRPAGLLDLRHAYRVRPKNQRAQITVSGRFGPYEDGELAGAFFGEPTHRLTLTTIDEEPVPGVYRDEHGNTVTIEKNGGAA
jgi:hypothetical protein